MTCTLIITLLLTLATSSPSVACTPVQRSQAVLHAFQKQYPCPSTGKTTGVCVGWVKDHIWPLCAGGADTIENLVWSPVNEAKLKDAWEKTMCRRLGCAHRGD